MSTFRRTLLFLLIIAALGGVIFLMTWDKPPPTKHYEVEIPQEQLPK